MTSFVVEPGGPLTGTVCIPGDKSVAHRSLIFGALATGRSTVTNLSGGEDNLRTQRALQAMGVQISKPEGASPGTVTIDGVGLGGLRLPTANIDCGNSGTTIRLLAGLLVAQQFGVRLLGDESLSQRPMRRIIDPLKARGGHISGVARAGSDNLFPPLSIAPLADDEALSGIEYEMPVASAQVKSALLLSGLYAAGPTAIKEPTLSRDHTERMMLSLGVPIETAGPMVVLDPAGWNRQMPAFDWAVPGDISSAAFLIAAAAAVPDSHVTLTGVGLNPTRSGVLDALRPMGAEILVRFSGDAAGGEPLGDIEIRHGTLRAGRVGGELLTRMVDEVPAFAVLAALATGVTEIRDAAELRVKESDRLMVMAKVLNAFGVQVEELDDGLVIHGASEIRPATVDSHGDHRIAMAAAVLALRANGESRIENVECVQTSFPSFEVDMSRLGARIRTEP